MADLSAFPITSRWPAQDPSVIRLYSFPTPNGVKASIALEEMGLACEPHLVTLSDDDVKRDAFLSLNPNNKTRAPANAATMRRSVFLLCWTKNWMARTGSPVTIRSLTLQ